ncbi:MAG: hypothetical protein BWY95_02277 [Bacteroidetes bacterium ADurb.BinA104]|nr:MAG: hypothetical protein BWY95_02277 [Bacteroidetes bacterium ADurb.BinA104]
MERVNHIDIVQVGRGSFVSNVHRMFERQIPYGKCLELGIPCLHPVFLFHIELTQADRHLTAAGAGSGHHHQRT